MFEKLDKIVVSIDDYEKISKWSDENRDKYESLEFPLEEGIILFHGNLDKYSFEDKSINGSFRELIYFKLDSNSSRLKFKIYDGVDMRELSSFDFTVDGEIENLKTSFNKRLYEKVKESVKATVAMLFDILQYMTHATQYVRESKETKTITKKQKGKNKSNTNKNKRVKISTIKYSFEHSESDEKRDYNRSAEMWRVRGHWRYYKKTGKRVWVKPHVKGEGENIETKEYRI